MRRVFVDTSAWYAYICADDPDHKATKNSIERWGGRLITTNFIFDEIVTLVRYRLGSTRAKLVGATLQDSEVVEMIRILPEDEEKAWKLFVQHKDKDNSFTDCTSFALMHRLGLETAISTDHHFKQAGFLLDISID